eukprot:scaffold2682_cov344-Pavlova_lutheri.AAC.29
MHPGCLGDESLEERSDAPSPILRGFLCDLHNPSTGYPRRKPVYYPRMDRERSRIPFPACPWGHLG